MIIWAFCAEEYIILCFLSLHVLEPLWQFHPASLCWIETGLWLFPLFYGVLLAERASGNYCNIGICISLVVQCFIGVSILLSSCGVYCIGLFVSPLHPSNFQTGWGDFVRIRRLKWKSYSPLQARFIIWNQKMLSRIHTSLFVWEPFYAFRI